jgi:hypothetical protein
MMKPNSALRLTKGVSNAHAKLLIDRDALIGAHAFLFASHFLEFLHGT